MVHLIEIIVNYSLRAFRFVSERYSLMPEHEKVCAARRNYVSFAHLPGIIVSRLNIIALKRFFYKKVFGKEIILSISKKKTNS